jgi:hypothetical protein
MKLYLTQILKEANSAGFGAPGQGGNSNDVAFASAPTMPTSNNAPAMLPQQQLGGMMLPQTNQFGMQPINTAPAKFKPSLI